MNRGVRILGGLGVLLLLAFLILALTGCMTMQPGQGVDEDFAQRWGCDPATVMARADSLADELPSGQMWVPQVGWSACDLMSHNGAPDDIDRQTSRAGRSASWWYTSGKYETRLISLDYEGGEWVVTYVGG